MKITNLDELIGKRVVVTADYGTMGYMIVDRHLNARRLAATGIVEGWVPGHGGDVVYVRQDDTPEGEEPIAVYCHLTELEFYSDEALTFAREKLKKLSMLHLERQREVEWLDYQIQELRLRVFGEKYHTLQPIEKRPQA